MGRFRQSSRLPSVGYVVGASAVIVRVPRRGVGHGGREIADCVATWVYGSGFPKSLNIGKAIDAATGVEREVVGTVRAGFGKRNGVKDTDGGIFLTSLPEDLKQVSITAPATPQAALWEGYGTALKPSFEPYVIARAPRSGYTYADLALTFGSGAINVDGGRVGTETVENGRGGRNGKAGYDGGWVSTPDRAWVSGRFPANTVFACTCAGEHEPGCPVSVLDAQSGESVSTGGNYSGVNALGQASGWNNHSNRPTTINRLGDSGGASRFFYQAKASSAEREWGLDGFEAREPKHTFGDGLNTATKVRTDEQMVNGVSRQQRRNIHPTVKPIRLCEYLTRLILPPPLDTERRLLIPFSGSGSEMIGAMLAGWDVIDGIEREREYVDIAAARIAWWSQFKTYEQAERAAKGKTARKQTPKKTQELKQLEMFLEQTA